MLCVTLLSEFFSCCSAEFLYPECYYAKCRYTECRGALHDNMHAITTTYLDRGVIYNRKFFITSACAISASGFPRSSNLIDLQVSLLSYEL